MAINGPTGYRKRRQRSTHHAHVPHQQHPPNGAPYHARPPQQLREDIHDEMDILSVKQETSKKFVLNHSLLENVTSKFFSVENIAPPRSFPEAVVHGAKFSSSTENEENKELLERDELILRSKLSNLLPNDITFGDFKLMKLKLKMLNEEIDTLEADKEGSFPLGDEFEYQSKVTEELTEKFGELNSKDAYKVHDEYIDEVVTKNYGGNKFQRELKEEQKVTIFSQPSAFGTRVTAASMEEERKKQEELEKQQRQQLAQQQQQQQQQQQAQNVPAPDIFEPQSQPPLVSMGPAPQGQQFDSYPSQNFTPAAPMISQAQVAPSAAPPPVFAASHAPPSQSPVQHAQPLPQQPQALQPPSADQYQNPQLDTFGMFPSNDKDLFGDNPGDDILMDDGAFTGLQSTLEDQIFFDHSME